MRVRAYTRMRCVYERMRACVCVRTCVCVCLSVCLCACVCVHTLRRNHPGDKDKALTVMEKLLEQQENQVPDFLCLCGRIYKDKFVESDYSDTDSRDKAIYW